MKTKFLSIHNKSLAEFGAKTYQELWKKAQDEGYKGLSMIVQTEIKKSSDSDNKFHAVFSTAKEDRHGEIVYQNWELKSFKNNPVYLDSHDYSSIEHILGKVEKIKADKILEGDIVFALENPKGLLAYKLTLGGFLNTSSVGFIPKEFDQKGNILKSELLEISAVSVPANAEALIDSQKSFVKSLDEVVGKKVNANEVLARMAKNKISSINKIAKAVESLAKDNVYAKRRELLGAIRNLKGQILED